MPSFWNINRQWGRGLCGFRGLVGVDSPARTARVCGGGVRGASSPPVRKVRVRMGHPEASWVSHPPRYNRYVFDTNISLIDLAVCISTLLKALAN
jgi:hypothetical protein